MSTFEFTEATEWDGRPVARRLADVRPRHRLIAGGVITHAHAVKEFGGCSYVVRLEDDPAWVELLFVGREEVPGLTPGATVTVEGVAYGTPGKLVVWNPLYRIEAPGTRPG